MSEPLRPRDAKQVEDAVSWALSQGKTLELIGSGSKRAIGRAAQWDATLDLSALSAVTLYEPEELVLSARAGTPLHEIEVLVAEKRQELAFEPMDYGPLFGGAASAATIGGSQKNYFRSPNVLLRAVAVSDNRFKLVAVGGFRTILRFSVVADDLETKFPFKLARQLLQLVLVKARIDRAPRLKIDAEPCGV